MMNSYKNKKVLITGHTGFKGAWLTAWLVSLGADVVGFSLDIPTIPSHFEKANLANDILDLRGDVRDLDLVKKVTCEAQPDFIFHLAAQALVHDAYANPIDTWQTNVMGTLNVLEALRFLDKKCAAVIITSDKCYENVEWVWGYKETDALGGYDPYSASKGAAELAIRSHVHSFFPKENGNIRVASARAGNVIGGGDWSANRIIPDCVRSWSKGDSVDLRSPHATRPWQHVLEPLSGYLTLGLDLMCRNNFHGESFNFGPHALHNHSVIDLVQEMSLSWSNVSWNDVSSVVDGPYEANLLKLNCDKALYYLQWHAVMNFPETVRMTADWYRSYYDHPAAIKLVTSNQIADYQRMANQRGLQWAKIV
jgi:CDP-glucose 4,6-dehydratase